MTRRQIRRIIEALGMAAHGTWSRAGYLSIALHIGEASRWRFGSWR